LEVAKAHFGAFRAHIFRFHFPKLFWIRRNNNVVRHGIAWAELINMDPCLKRILVEKGFMVDISSSHDESKSSININSCHMSTHIKLWAVDLCAVIGA